MKEYTTVFAELTRHLNRSDFEKAVQAYQADKGVKSLPTYDLFKQTTYGQLSGCYSVREIENTMKANRTRLYHAGLKEVKRSTFCDALASRDSQVFEAAFYQAVDKAQMIAGKTKKRFKDPLRIIDSSTITLCLKKFDWAKYQKTKGAVKLHLCLDGDNLFPYDAYLTNGKVHDVKAMDELCVEQGVIYVLDRGYVDYKSLYSIELGGSKYVTRMKRGHSFKRVKNNEHEKGGPIISDVLIEMTGKKTKKVYPQPIRKIKYYDRDYHHTYEFITNNLELSAQEIADIYKQRWQIELFFKWIKQHLNIKSFWGTSENAVWIQLWTALILSVLLWITQTLNGIVLSAYVVLQLIKAAILTKNTIAGLCTNTAPLPEIPSCQLVWEWGL